MSGDVVELYTLWNGDVVTERVTYGGTVQERTYTRAEYEARLERLLDEINDGAQRLTTTRRIP